MLSSNRAAIKTQQHLCAEHVVISHDHTCDLPAARQGSQDVLPFLPAETGWARPWFGLLKKENAAAGSWAHKALGWGHGIKQCW